MQLKSLEITNIRNIKKKIINFEKNNLIIGQNATGKTTIAECIYFCCFYKSFKTNKIKDLISFDENKGSIRLIYEHEKQINTININFYNNQKKFFFNNKEVDNIYEIINKIKCILITPNNIDLINDSPAKRRKYLNIILSQNNVKYLKNLIAYNKLLKIKNKILKDYQKTNNINLEYLKILNEKLDKIDKWIINERITILNKISNIMNISLKEITSNQEEISIVYNNTLNNSELEDIYQKELKYYKTFKGNHLDDFEFVLNSKDSKKFASQGQKRLITLCFFLAQKDLEFYNNQDYLLIFDDVSIDLDKIRQQKLLNYLQNKNQIIYIATDVLQLIVKQSENIKVTKMP